MNPITGERTPQEIAVLLLSAIEEFPNKELTRAFISGKLMEALVGSPVVDSDLVRCIANSLIVFGWTLAMAPPGYVILKVISTYNWQKLQTNTDFNLSSQFDNWLQNQASKFRIYYITERNKQ